MSVVAAACAVLVAGWAGRPFHQRRPLLAETDARALVGAVLRRPISRSQAMPFDRLVGSIVMAGAATAIVDVRLVPITAFGLWAHDVARRRRLEADRVHRIARELPELIDLFALAVAAGGSIHAALAVVVRRPIGPVSERLAAANTSIRDGARLSDELEAALADLGPAARPLLRALTGAEHYGTSLDGTLRRLGREARQARRRATELRARRVPVRLLAPLVLGVLPAFVLLTVVPTVARTLEGLSLTPSP